MIKKATFDQREDPNHDSMVYMMYVRTPEGQRAKTTHTLSEDMEEQDFDYKGFIRKQLIKSMRRFLEGQ